MTIYKVQMLEIYIHNRTSRIRTLKLNYFGKKNRIFVRLQVGYFYPKPNVFDTITRLYVGVQLASRRVGCIFIILRIRTVRADEQFLEKARKIRCKKVD